VLVRDDNNAAASTPAWYDGETGPRSRPGNQGVQSSIALNRQCLFLLVNLQIYHNPVNLRGGTVVKVLRYKSEGR
jgi:hypothetical protein